MLTRRRIEIVVQNFEYDSQFAFPDHELADHFRVGLERPRIELADRPLGWLVHELPTLGANGRFWSGTWRAAHQSFSNRDGKR